VKCEARWLLLHFSELLFIIFYLFHFRLIMEHCIRRRATCVFCDFDGLLCGLGSMSRSNTVWRGTFESHFRVSCLVLGLLCYSVLSMCCYLGSRVFFSSVDRCFWNKKSVAYYVRLANGHVYRTTSNFLSHHSHIVTECLADKAFILVLGSRSLKCVVASCAHIASGIMRQRSLQLW
jgi:hypothetical protein